MSDRWSRLAPLTGVVFAVLAVVAVFANNEEPPKASAGTVKVVAYFAVNRSKIETSSILFALAFLVLVLFAGALRSYLRRTDAAEGLGALVLAGGVLMATGALLGSGVEYGIAHNLHSLSPQEIHTLNFLGQEVFLPVLAGAFLFGVCSGLAIMRGAELPKWLGWVAIVLGVAAVIPPASFPALLGFLIWSVIVAILIYLRSGQTESAAGVPAAQLA